MYKNQKRKSKQLWVSHPTREEKKKKNSIINLCNCALLWYRVHDLSIYSYSFFLTFCTLLFVLVYLSISFKKIFCRSFFACEILNPSILRVREREREMDYAAAPAYGRIPVLLPRLQMPMDLLTIKSSNCVTGFSCLVPLLYPFF